MVRLCASATGGSGRSGSKVSWSGNKVQPPLNHMPTCILAKSLAYAYKEVSPNVQRAIVCNSKKKKKIGEKMTMMRRMDRYCSFTMKQYRAEEVNELSYMPQLGCFINADKVTTHCMISFK